MNWTAIDATSTWLWMNFNRHVQNEGMNDIAHGRFDFPWDAVFATHTRSGFRVYVFKIHLWRRNTRRRQHAFTVRIAPYWNKLPDEIVNPSSVELLKARLGVRWLSFHTRMSFFIITFVVYCSFYCSLDKRCDLIWLHLPVYSLYICAVYQFLKIRPYNNSIIEILYLYLIHLIFSPNKLNSCAGKIRISDAKGMFWTRYLHSMKTKWNIANKQVFREMWILLLHYNVTLALLLLKTNPPRAKVTHKAQNMRKSQHTDMKSPT